jgi:hypothetical protein
MNEISNAVPKRSKKQHLERFIALFQEQDGLTESLKGAKDNMAGDGYSKEERSFILSFAKAISKGKGANLESYIILMEQNKELLR